MSKLSSEERDILNAFEKGNLKRSKKAANTRKQHQKYAEAMFKKDARINIRLSSKDLRGAAKKSAGGRHPLSNSGSEHPP